MLPPSCSPVPDESLFYICRGRYGDGCSCADSGKDGSFPDLCSLRSPQAHRRSPRLPADTGSTPPVHQGAFLSDCTDPSEPHPEISTVYKGHSIAASMILCSVLFCQDHHRIILMAGCTTDTADHLTSVCYRNPLQIPFHGMSSVKVSRS